MVAHQLKLCETREVMSIYLLSETKTFVLLTGDRLGDGEAQVARLLSSNYREMRKGRFFFGLSGERFFAQILGYILIQVVLGHHQ